MQRAGRFTFAVLSDTWPDARSVTVFCGKGNNAGDGYIVAGLARQLGLGVTVVQVGPAPASGDAALAVGFAERLGVRAVDFTATGWRPGDVLVDAMLGTGQSGALREPFAAAVERVNRLGRPVLAIDVPTGLDADTGGPTGGAAGPVIRATVTATFITRKIGQFTGPGRELCGRLRYDDLGVPEALCGEGIECLAALPDRPPLPVNAYKHQRGHVVVCGGDLNMGGAVILAGEAALRSGAGMVTIATRVEHRPAILARRPELMVIDATDEAAMRALLPRADCIVLGPGLGRESWGAACLERVARIATAPMVLDADGFIHWLAAPARPVPAVVTPHIAEAARLLRRTAIEVQSDRPAAVRALVAATGAVAVLKGAGSLIADATRMSLCDAGNPGMATAGTGDVLCGVIAANLAAGEAPYRAAQLGVLAHAVAGDRAAARRRPHSMLASDVIDELSVLP
jgi:NAD(P)H-hydrate epimerase